MTVLDTNVLSETMKPKPSPEVIAWLPTQNDGTLAATAITVAEIYRGLAQMPEGRRKHEYQALAALTLAPFSGEILAFDVGAAIHYAEIVSARRRAGRPIQPPDAMIAAICRQHGARLATRNTPDFEDTGVALIDPWDFAQEAKSGVR